MPTLLDLDTLTELYPDSPGRRDFLRRAADILHVDRLGLQDALMQHDRERAGDLVHRLQGTSSFLTGAPERAAAIFLPLADALLQYRPDEIDAAYGEVDCHLVALESALGELTAPDSD